MEYSAELVAFVERLNQEIVSITQEPDDFGVGNIALFDPDYSAEEKDQSAWDWWGPNFIHIGFGCSVMSLNLANGRYRAWHSTWDDDFITAQGMGLEPPQTYPVLEDREEGFANWHECLALSKNGKDDQTNILFGALTLWMGHLRTNYADVHYLCTPDPKGEVALHSVLYRYMRMCVDLDCPGASESSSIIPD